MRGGFTVVETLVGLLLVAVVTGIAVARLPALVAGLRVAGGARELAAGLRLARGRAVAAGERIEARFDAARGGWEVVDADGVVLETRTLPPAVRFTALPASARIRFGGTGTAQNGTVTLAADGRTRRVVVNQRGRVRLQ